MISTEEFMRREQANGRRKRNRWILAGFVVVLIIVISVSVSVTQKNKKAADAFKTAERSQLREMIDTALNKEGITTVPLDSIESYQYRALDWLSKNKELPNYDRSTVLQRYALACFYFATNGAKTLYTPTPSPWKSSERWLSDMHECQWEGIECNTRNKVAGINLSEHNLSGALPQELVFLKDHLEVLDLTTNHLFIDGAQFDVFGRLSNLQIILMDDNYLSSSDGLPAAFGQCSNLVKLRLSYNLIGGQLNGKLLESFQKLTHLELESNFITGGIPNSVGHMHNLVYFYMRRNSLKFNLDFLKPGKMKSLFAMWLDSNDVHGTIPTEIGHLTELASMSITNATLTGTLPTEFGSLTGLRRLWLYGNGLTGSLPTELASLGKLEVLELQQNKLTGSVPQGVCDVVGASTYTHKSLTADCAKVTCRNCCTHCG